MNVQRSPRWKSPERERIERERERMMEEQEHERRRDATKLMVNVGSNPYLRDGQNIPRDR